MIDQLKNFSVLSLLNTAYLSALARHSDLHAEYAGLQHRLPIPASNSSINAQHYGHLDFLLRSMEDEIGNNVAAKVEPTSPIDMSENIIVSFSEMWIIGIYELLRSANEYSPGHVDMELFRDIETIRIPLAKYQIARDRKLRSPLKFAPIDDGDVPHRIRTYDNSDPQRNHIMPCRMSNRGSVMWCAIDVTDDKYEKWLERRQLSDRFLEYMRTLPKK